MATPSGEPGSGPAGREPQAASPLRPAVLTSLAGALLAAAGLLVGDERWQLVTWILGGTAAASGLLTIGYRRVERSVPLDRAPWHWR